MHYSVGYGAYEVGFGALKNGIRCTGIWDTVHAIHRVVLAGGLVLQGLARFGEVALIFL